MYSLCIVYMYMCIQQYYSAGTIQSVKHLQDCTVDIKIVYMYAYMYMDIHYYTCIIIMVVHKCSTNVCGCEQLYLYIHV